MSKIDKYGLALTLKRSKFKKIIGAVLFLKAHAATVKPGLNACGKTLREKTVETELIKRMEIFAAGSQRITVLTGAGISAESGIPTFRGPEGYWTIGAKEYHPQEMATHAMFVKKPYEVWAWYLYRLGVCRKAQPNGGHRAVVALEQLFQDRFTLITQNVDGLHLQAGNSAARTYQIHGNIHYMRCADECTDKLYPLPETVEGKAKGETVTEADKQLLCCPQCGHMTRPHVLWFDESYNEPQYRFYSSLDAAQRTGLLLVVGTAGATNLPNQVAAVVAQRGGTIIDVNIEVNPFSNLAQSTGKGFFIQESSGRFLPEFVQLFTTLPQ